MSSPEPQQPNFERERSKLRRAMHRSTIATVLVLLVAVGLAIAAALSATRAKQEQTASTENLWNALAAEAGNDNSSGKKRTLKAVASAVAIRPSPELRNRAISALAETEVRKIHEVAIPNKTIVHAIFSSDHRWVFVGTADGICEQIDVSTGEILKTFSEVRLLRGSGEAYRVFLSQRNRFLAMRYRDGSLVVWDVNTGRKIFRDRKITAKSTYRSLDFHPSKEHLMAYSHHDSGLVKIINLETGKTVKKIPAGQGARSVSISSDGERIGIAVGRKVAIYSFSGKLITSFETSSNILSVLWHPDGKRILAGCENACVSVFDLDHRNSSRSIKAQKKWLHRMSFSPSGDLLVTTGWDNLCRFFDFESGALVAELRGEFPHDFHHAGNKIAAYAPSKIAIFEIDRSEIYRPLGHRGLLGSETFNAIAISPDSRMLAGGNESSIQIWDSETGKILFREESGSYYGAAFSLDGKWLVTIENNGQFSKRRIEIQDGHLKLQEMAGAERPQLGSIGTATLTTDGKSLGIPGSRGGWIVDLSEEPKLSLAHSKFQANGVCSFSLSPDERFVAYSSWYGSNSLVWDHQTGEPMATLPGVGGGLQFSADSQTLATIDKDFVTFWNTADWTRTSQTARPADAAEYLLGIDWSHDGRFVAIGGEDGTVRLLDGKGDHQLLATLKNPLGDQIKRVQFNPDSTKVFSGGTSGLCHLWDLDHLENDLRKQGLHWDDDESTTPLDQAKIGRAVWLSGIGAIAAVIFGLFTARYHRSLSHRFESIEAVASKKADELREAEQQLLQSQKMEALGNLSAGIAHDFRNLLSVVGMSSELIAEDCDGREEILEETEQIQKAVRQGDGIVRSMLGFSRGSTDSDSVDVPPIAEDLITMLGQQFLSGISLDLKFPPDAPQATMTRGALEQCLLNLVVNASDAMDGHGHLYIHCKRHGRTESNLEILKPSYSASGYLALSVGDSGPGVPSDKAGRIFEPFFSTKEQGTRGGTGLGLSMVYRIAEKWGIGILLDPGGRESGRGATFTLLLPISQT